MKSKSLINSFLEYVKSHPDSLDHNLTTSVLYGTDEFKIKFQKQAIKIEDTGWIECNGINEKDRPDWIALFWFNNKIVVDLGTGDPYKKYPNGYTYKNYKYNLIPYKVTQNKAI